LFNKFEKYTNNTVQLVVSVHESMDDIPALYMLFEKRWFEKLYSHAITARNSHEREIIGIHPNTKLDNKLEVSSSNSFE